MDITKKGGLTDRRNRKGYLHSRVPLNTSESRNIFSETKKSDQGQEESNHILRTPDLWTNDFLGQGRDIGSFLKMKGKDRSSL